MTDLQSNLNEAFAAGMAKYPNGVIKTGENTYDVRTQLTGSFLSDGDRTFCDYHVDLATRELLQGGTARVMLADGREITDEVSVDKIRLSEIPEENAAEFVALLSTGRFDIATPVGCQTIAIELVTEPYTTA